MEDIKELRKMEDIKELRKIFSKMLKEASILIKKYPYKPNLKEIRGNSLNVQEMIFNRAHFSSIYCTTEDGITPIIDEYFNVIDFTQFDKDINIKGININNLIIEGIGNVLFLMWQLGYPVQSFKYIRNYIKNTKYHRLLLDFFQDFNWDLGYYEILFAFYDDLVEYNLTDKHPYPTEYFPNLYKSYKSDIAQLEKL